MKFVQDNTGVGNFIQKYQTGEAVINGTQYSQPFLVDTNQVASPWEEVDETYFSSDAIKAIIALKPKLVILGTGEKQRFPSADELQLLIEAQIGVECMTSAAACRTFNILLAEGREVVAGIIP